MQHPNAPSTDAPPLAERRGRLAWAGGDRDPRWALATSARPRLIRPRPHPRPDGGNAPPAPLPDAGIALLP